MAEKVGKLGNWREVWLADCVYISRTVSSEGGSAFPLLWLSPYNPDLHISINYRINCKEMEIESHAGGGRGRNSRVVSCVIATLPQML